MHEQLTSARFEIPTCPDEAKTLIELMDACVRYILEAQNTGDHCIHDAVLRVTEDCDHVPDVVIDINDDKTAIIVGDEQGYFEVEFAARLLSAWLDLLDDNRVLRFEYANYATKPTPNAYGGGAVALDRSQHCVVDSSVIADCLSPNPVSTISISLGDQQ